MATLVLLTAGSVLALNMYLPSLANIAKDLNTDYAVASLSISGFLLVNAVLQLVLGPIADRVGRRPVLLVAYVLFTVASVICALAETITSFLLARVVQASVIAGATLASAIISDTTKGSAVASRMAYVAMAMAVAPIIAPTIGGFLDTGFGWRSVFWLYALFGLVTLWLIWIDVGETNFAQTTNANAQMDSYGELLKSRRFWAYSVIAAASVGAFFLYVAAAPFLAAEVFDLSPAVLGVSIGAITGGFFFGTFLSGRYSERLGILKTVFLGRLASFVGVGAALLAILFVSDDALIFFAGAIFVGFGNGLSVPSARAGALTIRPRLAGSASGLSGAMTVAIGAGLTTLPGLVLTPQNADWLTLTMLLALIVIGLVATEYIRRLNRSEPIP